MSDRVRLVSRLERVFEQPARLVIAAIWLFLIAAALTVPVDRKGDASEYILATESLYYDRDLIVDNRVDIFRHLMQRPQHMDTPAGLTRITGPDGLERYGLHSFYYPLTALPFYALFGYRGFYLLNAALVAGAVTALWAHCYRRQSAGVALGFSVGAVFLSAAWSYVFWAQADALYASLVAFFLYLWFSERPRLAMAVFGPACAAQPALALLALPMLVDLAMKRRFLTAAACVAILAAWAAPQLAYNVWWLGTPLPMSRVGLASPDYMSLSLLARLLVDPAMGLIWFYPAVAYCLIRMRLDWRTISLVAASVGVLAAMTAVHTFYSHQVGSRYANWIFFVFLFSVEEVDLKGWPARLAAAFAVVVGAGLAINPLGNSQDMDVRHKTFLGYQLSEELELQVDYPELFKVSSRELVKDGLYAKRVNRDGWTEGGEAIRFLLIGAEPGLLVMEVRTWARPGERQRVKLRTLSGLDRERLLPTASAQAVSIELRPADLHFSQRWKRSYTYVTLHAEPWSPAIEQQGDGPEAHDLRRLGLKLERITLGGRVLFDRAASR
jgi:hypothetical protein